MEREIKFKAKKLYPYTDKKWVYGSLLTHGSCTYITPENPITPFELLKYRVDGNTVCQFAWHDDKHNQDIYEYDYDESGYCIIYCPICRGWAVAMLDEEYLEKGMKHLVELDNGRNENCLTCGGEIYLYEIVDDFKVVGNLMD